MERFSRDRWAALWRRYRLAICAVVVVAIMVGLSIRLAGWDQVGIPLASPWGGQPPVEVRTDDGGKERGLLGREDSARKIVVDVKGAVREPGVYRLAVGARVKEAVEAAGGALDSANLDGINLAAKVEDGSMVVVPTRPVQDAPGRSPAALAPALSGGGRATADASGEVVHLNSATAEDIDRLPGIGKSKAEAIVKFREEHGPFSSVDKLQEVPGIGPKLVERIRNQVDLQ